MNNGLGSLLFITTTKRERGIKAGDIFLILLSTAIPIYTNASQLVNSLIKNVLFLVPTDKVLELGFPK